MKELADFHGIEPKTQKVHGTDWVWNFSCFKKYLYYILDLFSVMEQIRSGEILFKANLKKQEEKRKLKKLKKEQSLLTKDRKIGSM